MSIHTDLQTNESLKTILDNFYAAQATMKSCLQHPRCFSPDEIRSILRDYERASGALHYAHLLQEAEIMRRAGIALADKERQLHTFANE